VSHPREDIGGNKIFFTFDPPSNQHADDLHKFWDGNAVNLAFPNGHDHDAANTLANQEPEGWQVDSQLTVDQWAEAWANDIFPTAVKAHDFTYLGNGTGPDGKPGFKVKIPGNTYPEFAGKVTRLDIHKAGWRLAAALEACLGED
jgi:hypothetical protein